MLLDQRQSVQRRQASRAPSVFDAQVVSEAPLEFGNSSLHGQGATQKEQVARLHRLNVGAEWSWRTRQIDAKFLQPFFGAGIRRVRGHYSFSLDITQCRGY